MSATGLEIRGNCKQSNTTYRGRKVSISVKCKEIWLAFLRVLSFCSFVPFVVNFYPWSWEPFCVADQRGYARVWAWMVAECFSSFVNLLFLPMCSFWFNPFHLVHVEKHLR